MNSAGTCISCSASVPGCTACDITGTSTVSCTTCGDGYKRITTSTPYFCVSCTSTTSLPNSGGNTTGFDANALTCTLSGTVVTIDKCKTGFTKFNGKCYSCTS